MGRPEQLNRGHAEAAAGQARAAGVRRAPGPPLRTRASHPWRADSAGRSPAASAFASESNQQGPNSLPGWFCTLDPRNGGFGAEAQRVIQEVREDAARCRELIGQAAGAGSLVAKVVPDTLDDEQTAKYQAVKDGRRDCRWQAAVATVLGRLEETLGFTQRQHDTLTAALLAASPAADELEGGSPLQPEPTVGLAATRLAAAVSGDTSLAALLDPWQRAALARPGSRARIWLKGSPCGCVVG